MFLSFVLDVLTSWGVEISPGPFLLLLARLLAAVITLAMNNIVVARSYVRGAGISHPPSPLYAQKVVIYALYRCWLGRGNRHLLALLVAYPVLLSVGPVYALRLLASFGSHIATPFGLLMLSLGAVVYALALTWYGKALQAALRRESGNV